MEQNTVIHTILLCFDQGPSVIAQYLLYFETLTALLLSCNCQYHLMWSEHDGACTTVCGWASELIDVLYCNIVHVCIDRTSSSSCVHNILCNHDRTPTLSFHLGVFFFQTVAAILSERMMMFTLPLSSVVLRSNGGGGTGSFHAIIPRTNLPTLPVYWPGIYNIIRYP